jgi:excinuclease ABC subunit A
VEVRGEKKSLGWFFHAITSEEWLLKMKFRTARNTFRKETLIPKLNLKPLNEMDAIPLYGTEPRVRVQRIHGPWQEIELKVHSMSEVDRPEFWGFLDLAIREFTKFTKKAEKSPNDLMPWKVLGEKWHFLAKGLVGGERLLWDVSLLRKIFDIIKVVSPDARAVWTNKVLVPLYLDGTKRKVEGRKLPWVVVHTKRVDGVYLEIYVAKNAIPLGRIRSIGTDPFVDGERGVYDVVQLKFTLPSQLLKDELKKILEESKSSLPRY